MSIQKKWYEIQGVEQLDTPALVIYIDRVKHNIQKLISGIDRIERLRPHVKTHKNKEITLLMMEAGIQKFKCATIAEAEMLGICKSKDVLLAYQPVGPKIERFIALQKEYPLTTYSCLVDNLTSAAQIDALAKLNNLQIPVYIDLNVGMNRTGISCDQHAVELYENIALLSNLKILGLHAYDGHIYESDLALRTASCEEIISRVYEVADQLQSKGFEPKLIMGGSPSLSIYAKHGTVECSPGTFIFWDKSYMETIPEQEFLPAALVVGRLVSKPAHRKICIDIGHKAIAAEYPLPLRISFLNALNLQIIGQSEEHLVLLTGENEDYPIGTVFYGIPMHICPTCALYDTAIIIENGKMVDKWEITARKRMLSI